MKSNLSEYDKRQIKRIYSLIDDYKSEKINIRKLIDNLEALYGCLEAIDEAWKKNFLAKWGTLEDTYSWAIYQERKNFDEKEAGLVDKAIEDIEVLLNALISQVELEDIEL
jgi:hypothetical protein